MGTDGWNDHNQNWWYIARPLGPDWWPVHEPKAENVGEVIVRVHDEVRPLINGNGHGDAEKTDDIEDDPPPNIQARDTNVIKELREPLQNIAEW